MARVFREARHRVFPGLRANLSLSGVGFSIGGRGAHIGVTSRGQKYVSVGIPGSGLSWREYERGAGHQVGGHAPPGHHVAVGDHVGADVVQHQNGCKLCKPGQVHVHFGWLVLVVAGAVILWLAVR